MSPSPRLAQHAKFSSHPQSHPQPHQNQNQNQRHAAIRESKSLLEEDDEADGLGDVLLPSVLKPTQPPPAHVVKAAPSVSGSVIDDEWNW